MQWPTENHACEHTAQEVYGDGMLQDPRADIERVLAAPHGIFGVPLEESIRYANVAISLYDDNGQSYIYGYVPIVVAKCGVYLKEKGEVEIQLDRLHRSR